MWLGMCCQSVVTMHDTVLGNDALTIPKLDRQIYQLRFESNEM